MKKKAWIIIVALVIVIAAAAACIGFLMPYLKAKSIMPEGVNISMTEREDGDWTLSFPAADQASYYIVEVYEPVEITEETEEEILPEMVFACETEETTCVLPALPDDRELTLKITPAVKYSTFTDEEIRLGENFIEVTTVFSVPEISGLEWTPDTENKTVSISFEMQEGDICALDMKSENGEYANVRTLDTCETTVTFGEEADLPEPAHYETYIFTLTASRNLGGIDFYGLISAEFSLVREDLLGRDVKLSMNDEGENVYSFTWQETKGEHYEVQISSQFVDGWVTVASVPCDGERSYTTPHLEPFANYEYRVVAVGGQTLPDEDNAAESEIIAITTKESAIFATIWPVCDLEVYSDTERTDVISTATLGKAYCVLEEKDGMFAVRTENGTGYIDSNYCLINLPDYMGDLCCYNITNSYRSIYMVHEYEIPRVTGVVTEGYENILQTNGDYLVPLMYPTAKKLLVAAQSAMEQGYKLKIYDAFRPYVATREIYDITERYMDDPIPGRTYTGKWVNLSALNLREGEEEITYELLMTNDIYRLNSFLARSGSTHNYGIALDLTIVDMETGYEVSMQTSIHDLSWYSVKSRNNSAANVLADIMEGAGFGDLSTEWWHFQDNEAKSELELPSVTYGVDAKGWVKDDYGWSYRDSKGEFYRDTTVTIDEKEYTFDAYGYIEE